jgi:hypothetical protein
MSSMDARTGSDGTHRDGQATIQVDSRHIALEHVSVGLHVRKDGRTGTVSGVIRHGSDETRVHVRWHDGSTDDLPFPSDGLAVLLKPAQDAAETEAEAGLGTESLSRLLDQFEQFEKVGTELVGKAREGFQAALQAGGRIVRETRQKLAEADLKHHAELFVRTATHLGSDAFETVGKVVVVRSVFPPLVPLTIGLALIRAPWVAAEAYGKAKAEMAAKAGPAQADREAALDETVGKDWRDLPEQVSMDTAWLRMVVDRDTGDSDGTVMKGRFEGRTLKSLSDDDFAALADEARDDEATAKVLEAWRKTHGG